MTPPYSRKWRGTKGPLHETERVEWKSWFKIQHSKNEDHCIRSHDFMTNRWETVEIVADFILLGSKITVNGDCSHEIKRHLFLGRKAVINLDSILKSRDITLPTNVWKIKALVFPVVTYACESWTIKNAECQKIYVFKLPWWRRLLTALGQQGDQTSQS